MNEDSHQRWKAQRFSDFVSTAGLDNAQVETLRRGIQAFNSKLLDAMESSALPNASFEEVSRRYDDATQEAMVLIATLSPGLPEPDVRGFLAAQLDLTTAKAVAAFSKKFAAEQAEALSDAGVKMPPAQR